MINLWMPLRNTVEIGSKFKRKLKRELYFKFVPMLKRFSWIWLKMTLRPLSGLMMIHLHISMRYSMMWMEKEIRKWRWAVCDLSTLSRETNMKKKMNSLLQNKGTRTIQLNFRVTNQKEIQRLIVQK